MTYRAYVIVPEPSQQPDGRWAVAADIRRGTGEQLRQERFIAEDGISYLLEIEAVKESVNLAKNLIDRGLVGF